MKLAELLTPDCTFCAVAGTSKKRILDKISEIAATKIPEHSQFELLESLTCREKIGSTGIGNGIAIPHGRLTNTEKVVVVLLTTDQAIPFDAIDNRNVDIFIALFVPENACQEHLTTLKSIAQFFGEKQTAKKVRKCQNNQELFNVIQSINQ